MIHSLATIPFFSRIGQKILDNRIETTMRIDFGPVVGTLSLFLPMLSAIVMIVYARRVNGLSVSGLGLTRVHIWKNVLLGLGIGGVLLGLGFVIDLFSIPKRVNEPHGLTSLWPASSSKLYKA